MQEHIPLKTNNTRVVELVMEQKYLSDEDWTSVKASPIKFLYTCLPCMKDDADDLIDLWLVRARSSANMIARARCHDKLAEKLGDSTGISKNLHCGLSGKGTGTYPSSYSLA